MITLIHCQAPKTNQLLSMFMWYIFLQVRKKLLTGSKDLDQTTKMLTPANRICTKQQYICQSHLLWNNIMRSALLNLYVQSWNINSILLIPNPAEVKSQGLYSPIHCEDMVDPVTDVVFPVSHDLQDVCASSSWYSPLEQYTQNPDAESWYVPTPHGTGKQTVITIPLYFFDAGCLSLFFFYFLAFFHIRMSTEYAKSARI